MNTHRAFRPGVGGTPYSDADSFLGKRDSRKLENHTYLKRHCSTISILLWNTYVVTYNKNGSVILDTGGYHTVTTKERINHYNPLGYVWTDRGDWWYSPTRSGVGEREAYEFKNGMVIQPDGIPDTTRRELVILRGKVGKDFTETEAVGYIAGLELIQVKRLVRNKYLRQFILEHCRKEYVPAFISNEALIETIEGRLNEQDSR